jgi:hypothetical protein
MNEEPYDPRNGIVARNELIKNSKEFFDREL